MNFAYYYKYIYHVLVLITFVNANTVLSQDLNLNNNSINNNYNQEKNINFELRNPAAQSRQYIGSPTSFANANYYNSPWNFTSPEYLFHPTKTINDHSAFHKCRLINTKTPIRDSLKDKLLGVFDEKEFISTGVGKLRWKPPVNQGNIIVCGINTQIPAHCVRFIGTGYVYMNEYVSTEAALVAISREAINKGSNLVGNVNCPFQENITNRGGGVGGALGKLKYYDALSAGGNIDTSHSKRTIQPHCSGDFYTVTGDCVIKEDTYRPTPRPYRRYLPANNSQRQYLPPQHNQPVRGKW